MNKTKILIVEDEAIVALFLKLQLEKKGYQVTGHVTSGEQAIQSVQLETPDIILMDIHLAGKIDGLEASKSIRSFSKTNIIVMTGYEDEALRNFVKELTFAAILIKPVSINDIIIIIEEKFKYIA